MTPETKIKKSFLKEAAKENILSIPLAVTSMRGIPDRLVLMKNMICFIEFKSSEGKFSAYQREVKKRLNDLGFVVYEIRTKADVIDVIRDIKKWN
jgi:hypothetical protein